MPFDTDQLRQQFEEQLKGNSTLTQSLQILGSAEEGSFTIVLYAEVHETRLRITTVPPETTIHTHGKDKNRTGHRKVPEPTAPTQLMNIPPSGMAGLNSKKKYNS